MPNTSPRWPAVVFDLDGTVLDSSEIVVAALNQARTDLNLPPVAPAAIRSGIGLPLRGMVAMLCNPGEDVDAITAGYRTHYIRLAPLHEAAFDGMKALIADLAAAGVALGIATGKSQHGADNAAGRHDLGQWIPAVHGIIPGTPGKPDPAVLVRALADLSVSTEQAVFIGDTTYDMNLAAAIGVETIGVLWGVHDEAALRGANARHLVSDVAGLRALLLPG
ncbi:MAG: phosphoglycolate phosphatase [Myxococcota bacterium]|jgi:phosphoglycolate phosphatase